MSEILRFLETIDEEYLIGLSNKGIVKRSYKDLETTDVQVTLQNEEILGQCGDAQVTLRRPITNSTCSCPSTSICKHVIMTILAAQKAGENTAGADSADAKTGEKAADAKAAKNVAQESPEAGDALSEISAERLKKSIGSKEWIRLLTQTDFDQDFEMTEGKLLTVHNRRTDVTLKLIFPLEWSTCSACHDDRLCVHKAAAILARQMRKGVTSLEELMDVAQQADEFDEERIPDVLRDLRILLEDLLMAGSARLSSEMPLGLERMALRAHNARLPVLEEKLRVLAENVAGYLGRVARVTAADLMSRIAECFGVMERMEAMLADGKSVYSLAGTFRSDYSDVPELLLHGVGMRAFESASGYAGKTLYFFEEKTKIFYTYTVARPTIYEKGARRNYAAEAVPWGLVCTLTQLSAATVRLRGGKANGGRRLSSTSQARAELITVGGILPEDIAETIYDDFEALWKAYLAKVMKYGEDLSEADKLFLIRPNQFINVHYDEIAQKLVFWFEDIGGRRLRGELVYSRQEEAAIKSIEKLEKKLKCKEEEMPVFLGVFYAENGECCFYPIETVGQDRLV